MKRILIASFFIASLFGFSIKASAQCTGTLITGFNVTNISDVTCFGGSDGQIQVTLVGGQAPFTYSLVISTGSGDIPVASIPNTNSQVVTFTGLFANAPVGGTYKVALVTSNGGTPLITCKNRVISSIDVDEPTVLTASVASITSSCAPNTGAISLNVSGGTPGYTYSWSGPTAIGNTIEDPTGLAGGTYSVSVRDANYNAGNPGFCEVVINNLIIVDPASISLTSSNTSTCITAGATTANLPYSSTTGTPNQYSIDFDLTAQGAGFVDVSNAALPASPIIISVAPGTPAAVYNATLTVRNTTSGCVSASIPITVTINALPVVSAPSPNLCVGLTMTLSPTVGGTWLSSDATKATVTNAGLVTGVAASAGVTFTFTNSTTGCSSTTSSVAITAAPTATISYVGIPFCQSIVGTQSVTLSGTGAFAGGTYSALPAGLTINAGTGAITPSSSTANTYTVTYTIPALGGCAAVPVTTSVTINTLPVVNAPSPSLCIGGTMNLIPNVGGNWISNDLTKATVTAAGVVTGVSSGIVTFTFTNSTTGCSNTTSSVVINSLPVVSAPSASLCIGSTMTLSPTVGGTWVSSDATKATVTNAGLVTGVAASAGVTFTFTNSTTGCSNTTSSIAINALPVVNAPSPNLCIGGTMNLTPNSGGTWVSSDATKATVTNAGLVTGIGVGSVTFTFTDGAGCSATTSSVSINPIPGYNAIVTDVTTCPPGNDGTITVNAFGGSGAGYTYSKDNGSTFQGTNLFSSLTPGNYLVVVKDGAGCTSLATNVTVGSPSSLTFTFTQQNVLCNGGNNGSATITPSGGSGSYTYSNDNGVTFPGSGASFTFSSLVAATYPVVVKDSGTGCQFSSSVIITQPTLVSFSFVKTDATCNGASDGIVTVTASGGNGSYSYSSDNGTTFQASNVFSGLPAATYQVIVKDGNNCLSLVSSVNLNQPTAVTFSSILTDPSTCIPGNDGTITIAALGGNGTYQYSNDNGTAFQPSNVFNALGAGSYQVIVKDASNCLSNASTVSLTAPGGVTFSSATQDVTCNGGADGRITLTTSGGNGSYVYSKDNGVTFAGSGSPFIFNSLTAGTYQVVAKDGNGCEFSSSITVIEPLLVTFTTVDVNSTCNGSNNGSITITASGGNNTYQYSKDNGLTFQLGNSFTTLLAAIYQVVVKDGNSCISLATPVTITEPAFVSAVFSGLAGPYCTSSGVVNLIPTTLGGTFTGPGVSGSTFSPSLAGAGTHTIQYSVTIGGCSNLTTQTVSVISSVVDGSFVGLNPTYCLSSIAVTLTPATTGGTFIGSGIAGNIFNPSSAGSGTHLIQYSVVSGGCTSTTTQSVNVLLGTDPICTSGVGTGTCATVVIVPTPSPATCTSSDGKIFFSITPSVPIINTTGVKIDIRGISSTNLGVSRTNFNDPTFLNLPLGTYDFSIEYGEVTCTKTGQVTIGQSGTVGSPVASNIVRPLCFGEATGSLTLDVPGETGNLLEWSLDATSWIPFTAGSVISGVPAGIAPLFDRVISVRRNSSDLCNAALIIVLQEINPAITATIVPSNATCSNNDGLLTLSGIGGGSGLANFTYKLNGADLILPADKIIKGLSAGTYTLSIVDNIGCQKDLTPVNVSFPGYVNYTVPVATAPDCAGTGNNGSISFQITDSGSFLVGYTLDPIVEPTNYFDPAGAPIVISNLSNGNYFIWIKSSGTQCATKLSPISINGTFPINFNSAATNILCFGSFGEIKLTSIKGAPNLDFTFELIKGGVTSAGLITVSQALGEVVIPSLTVGNYQLRLTQNQASIVPACTSPIFSLYQDISIAGPSESLDTLYVNKLISVPDLATGSMLVGIKESQQDPYEVMLELIDPLFPGQEFIMDWTATIFNKQNLKFELAIRSLFAGEYKLSLRDALGCVKEYEVVLDVDTNIAVPNVFTPNDDGFNDVFFIRNLPADANLVITNRWGKEVFSSGSYQNDWGGGDISDGVYFYRLNFSGDSLTGWVEILRGK